MVNKPADPGAIIESHIGREPRLSSCRISVRVDQRHRTLRSTDVSVGRMGILSALILLPAQNVSPARGINVPGYVGWGLREGSPPSGDRPTGKACPTPRPRRPGRRPEPRRRRPRRRPRRRRPWHPTRRP